MKFDFPSALNNIDESFQKTSCDVFFYLFPSRYAHMKFSVYHRETINNLVVKFGAFYGGFFFEDICLYS